MFEKFLVMHDAILFMPINDDCIVHSASRGDSESRFSIHSLNINGDVLVCFVRAPSYGRNIYTSLNNRIYISKKLNNLQISSHLGDSRLTTAKKNIKAKNTLRLHMDGYMLSVFVNVLKISMCYRYNVINHFKSVNQLKDQSVPSMRIIIQLKYPNQDIIDYAWNERMERLSVERRELDNAMSWLSTLGGAFSALGDEFQHCAKQAGLISLHQLKIALQLGDPLTVARCKLYVGLSLMQRGYLSQARQIVRGQYRLARSAPVVDLRLVRMCLGVWAKLQYLHKLRHQR